MVRSLRGSKSPLHTLFCTEFTQFIRLPTFYHFLQSTISCFLHFWMNLLTYVVTLISLRQLENFFTFITSSAFVDAKFRTIFTLRRSVSTYILLRTTDFLVIVRMLGHAPIDRLTLKLLHHGKHNQLH